MNMYLFIYWYSEVGYADESIFLAKEYLQEYYETYSENLE